MLKLITPDIKYLNSFIKHYNEYIKHKIKFEDIEVSPFNWKKYIKNINNLKYNNINNKVTKSIFWLVDENNYIGTGILRHNLTRQTEEYEGHIDYIISPLFKNSNYDVIFINLLLKKAKEQKINYALMISINESYKSSLIFKNINAVLLDEKYFIKNNRNYKIKRYIIYTGLGIIKYINKNFNPQKDNIKTIKDKDITLNLNDIYKDPSDEINIKLYEYFIYKNDFNDKLGRITLRIGCNENIYYSGNIGYSILSKYRGNYYAGKSCILLKQLLKNIEIYDKLIITVNPNNLASRKTCEYINAKLLEIVNIPPNNEMYIKGEYYKCRYIF